jgi:hypothetical protein
LPMMELIQEIKSIPFVSAGMILLLLLAMAILFGGADEALEMDDIVLAVSAAIDGDLIDDTDGEITDCVVTDGDLNWTC